MRIFITGASGHIASEVIPELISAGHSVVGLARSTESAAKVSALGADAVRGDLSSLDVLADAAREADGVIHLAFDHGLQGSGDLEGAVSADISAVQAIGEALSGSDKPFVGTNATGGISLIGGPGLVTEEIVLPGGPRIDTENAVIALAQSGVRASVVRLPPAVHSDGVYGFVSHLIELARATGVSGYCGDGSNRWGSTDARDVARVYRLAIENAPAGSRLHAVAEEGIALRQIAETISARLGVPATSIPADEAGKHFGFLAPFVAMDNPASSAITRELLGWEPSYPGLIADLEQDPALV